MTRTRTVRRALALAAAGVAAVLLAGCGGSDLSGSRGGPQVACPAIGFLQSVTVDVSFFNGLPDAGSVQITDMTGLKTFTGAQVKAASYSLTVSPNFDLSGNSTANVQVIVSDEHERVFEATTTLTRGRLLADSNACPTGFVPIRLQATPPNQLIRR